MTKPSARKTTEQLIDDSPERLRNFVVRESDTDPRRLFVSARFCGGGFEVMLRKGMTAHELQSTLLGLIHGVNNMISLRQEQRENQ